MIHQKQRSNASMVSEKSAASEESQGSDACEESVHEGRAMTMLLGVNAGRLMRLRSPWRLAVNPFDKSAMNHSDFCMMVGSASENNALQWISNESVSMWYGTWS